MVILALAGCVATGSPISSARDVKLLLDEKGIPCESFDVSKEEETNAEILSCLDGTVSQDQFFFIIWKTADAKDRAFSNFCQGIESKGSAATELIVGKTWVAYSASDYFPISALAEELGSEVGSGAEICETQGLEVASSLNEANLASCQAIIANYEDLASVEIRHFNLVSLETLADESLSMVDRIGSFNGSAMNVSFETLTDYEGELFSNLRALYNNPDTPANLASAARDVDYYLMSKAAHAYGNQTSPEYLFTNFPDVPNNPTTSDKEMVVQEMNRQLSEHNSRVAEFRLEKASVLLQVAIVIDICRATSD